VFLFTTPYEEDSFNDGGPGLPRLGCRGGRPDRDGADGTDAVAYLLSDQAAFVNGVVLPVDGGRAALGVDPEAT
jgi:NAD(P)-dependent dehydrogenase (short-subunit alcohol dehydrogenase family)